MSEGILNEAGAVSVELVLNWLQDFCALGRRAIRSFCTTADQLLGKNAHQASLAGQHPDIAAVVAQWERTLPAGYPAGSPTPAAYAGWVRALVALRAQHGQGGGSAAFAPG